MNKIGTSTYTFDINEKNFKELSESRVDAGETAISHAELQWQGKGC